MSLFNREQEEKRSIEDILTPKEAESESEKVADDVSNKKEEKSVADEKLGEITAGIQVETPEEANFNALTCFGWSETKTPKWLIKCAHFWYGVMSFFWFIVGALTFAPIIFVQKKIRVIFKSKFKSFIVSCIVYAIFVALIVLIFTSRGGADVPQNVEEVTTDIMNITSRMMSIG